MVTKEALETLIGHLEVWALIFGVIVVVGVAGESFFGVRIWWNNRRLQVIQRSENIALQLKVAQANDRAAKLEQKLADRHITLEQRKKMLEILRPQAGAKVTIWYVIPSDIDSLPYSEEIRDVFDDAGWIVFTRPNLISTDTPFPGFLVELQNDSLANRQLVALIAKAMAVTTYPVSHSNIRPDPNLDTDIRVLVGRK